MSRKVSSSRQSVGDAARQLVGEQLSLVLRRLSKAATAPADKPELIHRVRVATRRARAALDLYAPVLPPKHAKWFLRKLSKLRKAADETRNLDVFLVRMHEEGTELPAVVGELIATFRKRSQRPLIKLEQRLTRDHRWQKKCRDLLSRIGKSKASAEVAKQPIKTFAPTALAPLLDEFRAALTTKDRSAAQLHRLRIAGKKLRYAVELVKPSLPKRLTSLVLTHLERMQAVLGDLNDLATADDLVSRLAEQADKRSARQWFKAQRKRERVAFSQARAKFLRTWTPQERQKWQDWVDRVSPKHPPR